MAAYLIVQPGGCGGEARLANFSEARAHVVARHAAGSAALCRLARESSFERSSRASAATRYSERSGAGST